MKSGAGSPSAITRSSSRRAVGVVRVSRIGNREGETFVSKPEQRQRIEDACAREGLRLVDTLEEDDVSGGAALDRRPGLSKALAAIENGEADVLVVAYFDRLVRSLARQAEILERVEHAGGHVVAVDIGEVRADTAATWLSSTMLGAVSEYHRRVTAERTADAKRRAVERGVPPFPNVPPGYRRRSDSSLEPDPDEAPIVADAFALRAGGASIREVRDFLRSHGIQRSYHGVQALLASRIVLGELRFGDLVNPAAHDPIVHADVWRAVQRARTPRGRRARSEHLLARLGVLRCAACGARMVVGSANRGAYPLYRCPPVGDCSRRVTISAALAERVIVAAVKEAAAHLRGTATADPGIAAAEQGLVKAEQALEAAVYAFDGLDDVEAARSRLAELRATRDAARTSLARLASVADAAATLSLADDWADLTMDEQRSLIRALLERADVLPASEARGPERIVVYAR